MNKNLNAVREGLQPSLFFQLITAIVVVIGLINPSVLRAQCTQLVWQDEFETPSLDQTKWSYTLGRGCDQPSGCGFGNGEEQAYTNLSKNISQSNGILTITTIFDNPEPGAAFSAAKIQTLGLKTFQYGKIEARMKLPSGQGAWPAFWMLAQSNNWPYTGEIDIMEAKHKNPTQVIGTVHHYNGFTTGAKSGTPDLSLAFHTYAIEWEKDEIRWYFDGELYHRATPQTTGGAWPFNNTGNPFYLILNSAVGGLGTPFTGNQAFNSADFPTTFQIDYVRVYSGTWNVEFTGDPFVYKGENNKVYSLSAVAGASYNWSVPAGATIASGQGTNQIIVNFGTNAVSGNVTAAVTSGCATQTYSKAVSVENAFQVTTILKDWDANNNMTFKSASGTLTQVVNPSGTTNVGRYVRNAGQQYDNLVFNNIAFGNASDFVTRRRRLRMDVYSNAPVGTKVRVQLENSARSAQTFPAGRHSVYETKTTLTNQWETLEFEYVNSPDLGTGSTTVDQIAILFAVESSNGSTYHIDNVQIGTAGTLCPRVLNQTLEDFQTNRNITFNSSTGVLTQPFANPNTTGVNTSPQVGRYVRNGGELYDVLFYRNVSVNNVANFKNGKSVFKMQVNTGAPVGTVISLQLETGASTPSNYPTGRHSLYQGITSVQNQWETIEFSFVSALDALAQDTDVNSIVFLFAPNSTNASTYYIDNLLTEAETCTVDSQPPTAPSALTSPSKTNNSVSLSWTGSTDNVAVTGYEVFVNSETTPRVTVTTTTATIPGLAANTAYAFRVRAKDAVPNYSGYSNTLTVTTSNTTDTTPPTTPSGLASPSKTNSSVSLAWTGSTDNVAVTGYEVYVNTETTPRTTVTTTTATITGLNASTTYAFKVRAKDAVPNFSTYSNTINVTTDGVGLPTPWATADIGAVGAAGSASHSSGTFTLIGSGADIWGTADEFRYVYQSITGNFTITARLSSITNTDPWAKAGVMAREGTAANGRHVLTAVTTTNGLAFQRRTTAGGESAHTAGPAGAAPYWVRLTRAGNVFTGFVSTNGTTWTQIGTETIAMTSAVNVGLAVTSHNDAVLSTAVFDNVSITSGNIPVTGVTMSPTSAIITAGGTQQLTATVAPANATNKTVSWSSSNTTVATVNASGLVTTVSAGSATITVSTQDGNRTATSAITVNAVNVPVTGVTVSPATATIGASGTQQLTATVAPANATNKTISWSSNNTAVATVNGSGLVSAVSAGSATITVTTQDGNRTATSAITVTSTGGTNLALNKATTTSSNETAAFPGSLAVDGNATTTRWSSAFADPQWIYVDLGASYNVNRVKVTWEAARASAYLVQISSDASNWSTMKTISGNTTTVNDHTGLTGTGRYVRIYGTARATVYGYSIFELEVYGTPSSVGGTCSGSDTIGDYTYQVSTASGTVNWKFIPGAPIAGSTLSIIYIKVGSAAYVGNFMTASGSEFTFSQTYAAGTSLTFYFTYRVGTTGAERSSVANPHTYSAGATCSGKVAASEQGGSFEDGYDVYPNPVVNTLTIRGAQGGSLGIVNAQGIEVSGQRVLTSDDTDVSHLVPGVYHAILFKNNRRYVKRFMKRQ
jgi:beta-glucanase (GH16 family)/uncharacterized protein YjdB/chitodextrinase